MPALKITAIFGPHRDVSSSARLCGIPALLVKSVREKAGIAFSLLSGSYDYFFNCKWSTAREHLQPATELVEQSLITAINGRVER